MATEDEWEDPERELLRMGSTLGYLTYDMLNAGLPADITAARLDALLMEIVDRGIHLIDSTESPYVDGD